MTDTEILCQALEQYACRTAKDLFGISSVPAQTLVRYAIRNSFGKYGTLLSMFTDSEGGLNMKLMVEAFEEELKARGGLTVLGIKFTDQDVKEIYSIYGRLKSNV